MNHLRISLTLAPVGYSHTLFKKRGADTVQLEFNQTIYKDAKTGKWHVDD